VEERHESLWIRIQVDLDVKGAIDYMDRFDREWWANAYRRFFGDIQAMTEFLPRVRS
jgi:hypothetical protein